MPRVKIFSVYTVRRREWRENGEQPNIRHFPNTCKRGGCCCCCTIASGSGWCEMISGKDVCEWDEWEMGSGITYARFGHVQKPHNLTVRLAEYADYIPPPTGGGSTSAPVGISLCWRQEVNKDRGKLSRGRREWTKWRSGASRWEIAGNKWDKCQPEA